MKRKGCKVQGKKVTGCGLRFKKGTKAQGRHYKCRQAREKTTATGDRQKRFGPAARSQSPAAFLWPADFSGKRIGVEINILSKKESLRKRRALKKSL